MSRPQSGRPKPMQPKAYQYRPLAPRPPDMAISGTGHSGRQAAEQPYMTINGVPSNENAVSTGPESRWADQLPQQGGSIETGPHPSSIPLGPLPWPGYQHDDTSCSQNNAPRFRRMPEALDALDALDAPAYAWETRIHCGIEDRQAAPDNTRLNQVVHAPTGWPEDPADQNQNGDHLKLEPSLPSLSAGAASALQHAYIHLDAYTFPEDGSLMDRSASPSTHGADRGQHQASHRSSEDHRLSPDSNLQAQSVRPPDMQQQFGLSPARTCPAEYASAVSRHNEHPTNPQRTERVLEIRRMEMSATAQGSQSDGHVRNGPIDVSAALVNLAQMRARSDNHSKQDDQMDTEELIDADGSMRIYAQMDGDAEEGMGADMEESMAGHPEQRLGGDNGSTHEEEQPSKPIQEVSTNPPTPVFSPVIPLKSVTTLDADAIRPPETPLVEASPPPRGLHLLGIEDIADKKEVNGNVDMDAVSRGSTPLTVLPSDLEEIQQQAKEPSPEPATQPEVEAITRATRQTAQRLSGRKVKSKMIQHRGGDSTKATAPLAESHDTQADLESPSAAAEPTSTILATPTPTASLQVKEVSPQGRPTRSTRSSHRKETSIAPHMIAVAASPSQSRDATGGNDADRKSSRKGPKRDGARDTTNGDGADRKSSRKASKRSGASAVATSSRLSERRNSRSPHEQDDQVEVISEEPQVVLPPKPRVRRSHAVEIQERQKPDGTWEEIDDDGQAVIAESQPPIQEEAPGYMTLSGRRVRPRERSIAPKEVSSTVPKTVVARNGPKISTVSIIPSVPSATSNKGKTKTELGHTDSRPKRKEGDATAADPVDSQDVATNGHMQMNIEVMANTRNRRIAALEPQVQSGAYNNATSSTGPRTTRTRAISPQMDIDTASLDPDVNISTRAGSGGAASPMPSGTSSRSRGTRPPGQLDSRDLLDSQNRPEIPAIPMVEPSAQHAARSDGHSSDTLWRDLIEHQNRQARLHTVLLTMLEESERYRKETDNIIDRLRTLYSDQAATPASIPATTPATIPAETQATNPPVAPATVNRTEKSSRPKAGTAIIRTKNAGTLQIPKKRKVDRHVEGDTGFIGSLKPKKKTGSLQVTTFTDDSRSSKRARTTRFISDTALDDDWNVSKWEQGSRKAGEAIRLSCLGKTEELQAGICALSRYGDHRQCKDCTSREEDEDCRFKGWRVFPINPDTGMIAGDPWFDHQVEETEELIFPTKLNRDFTADQCFRMKETVVKPLLPLITRELKHCIQFGAKRKSLEVGTRLTCDRCSMTLFGGSWSCVACGKEYCFECELEMTDKAPLNVESYEHDNARLYKCSKGSHSRANLFATTIFDLKVLQFHWLQMIGFAERAGIQYDKQDVQQLLPNENVAQLLFPTIDVENLQSGEEENRQRAAAAERIDPELLKRYKTTQSHDTFVAPESINIPVHAFYRINASELNEPLFDRMWGQGIPVVIDNAGMNLSEDWTPEGFKKQFGREACFVFDCQAEVAEDCTIEDFYNLFDSENKEADAKVLKLKDWPGNTEFKAHCPTLYDDFMHSLPVPDYTRRDGVTNISAFFPINTTPPDIGPKLYSALRGQQTEGGKGSTRMHMDIADAINVMTYASKNTDGHEGCAVWHIYREQDLDQIRKFLKDKFGTDHVFNDPVHSQVFYLDTKLRKELFDDTRITSYEIYQYPGQAVMIPAYCAHQNVEVLSLMHGYPPLMFRLKCSFLPITDSITRCAKITQEFRGENVVSDWKDDVLQLNNMMWYTWLFCQKFDKDNQNSLALPFDENSVGTFIEANSTQQDLSRSGLAHLKRNRTADERIPQQRGTKSTTPIWSRRAEIVNKVASKPRRGLQTPLGGTLSAETAAQGTRQIAPAGTSQRGSQPVRPNGTSRRPHALASSAPSSHSTRKPQNAQPRPKHTLHSATAGSIPTLLSEVTSRPARYAGRLSNPIERTQGNLNSLVPSVPAVGVVPPFPKRIHPFVDDT